MLVIAYLFCVFAIVVKALCSVMLLVCAEALVVLLLLLVRQSCLFGLRYCSSFGVVCAGVVCSVYETSCLFLVLFLPLCEALCSSVTCGSGDEGCGFVCETFCLFLVLFSPLCESSFCVVPVCFVCCHLFVSCRCCSGFENCGWSAYLLSVC